MDSTEQKSSQQHEIDPETGEVIGRVRKGPPESRASAQSSRGKIPKIPGKNSQNRVQFISVTPLGAHVMAMAKLTGRQYQIMFVLMRDMDYDGKSRTHPDYIAEEIGMDPSDVRKALRVLEDKDILFRVQAKNKGHCYWFNPAYVSAKPSGEVKAMSAIWLAVRRAESEKRSGKTKASAA